MERLFLGTVGGKVIARHKYRKCKIETTLWIDIYDECGHVLYILRLITRSSAKRSKYNEDKTIYTHNWDEIERIKKEQRKRKFGVRPICTQGIKQLQLL